MNEWMNEWMYEWCDLINVKNQNVKKPAESQFSPIHASTKKITKKKLKQKTELFAVFKFSIIFLHFVRYCLSCHVIFEIT